MMIKLEVISQWDVLEGEIKMLFLRVNTYIGARKLLYEELVGSV
jgi:hypothetical protein